MNVISEWAQESKLRVSFFIVKTILSLKSYILSENLKRNIGPKATFYGI